MSLPATALKQAIRETLTADPALLALLGGASVLDEVPRQQAAPFIVFGECVTRDASSNTSRGHETLITLHALSTGGGQREAQQIAARVEALLHDATLTLAGHQLVNLTLTSSESRRERNNEATRATLKFRAFTEPV